jgi:hypothetical protein
VARIRKKKFRRLKAVGTDREQAQTGQRGIDKILALRGEQQNIGHGRLITTVGCLDDIHVNLGDGWDIMWCQMCKLIPDSKGAKASE